VRRALREDRCQLLLDALPCCRINTALPEDGIDAQSYDLAKILAIDAAHPVGAPRAKLIGDGRGRVRRPSRVTARMRIAGRRALSHRFNGAKPTCDFDKIGAAPTDRPRMFAENWNSAQRSHGKPGLYKHPTEVLGADVIALGTMEEGV
jgi:hypothetical protein